MGRSTTILFFASLLCWGCSDAPTDGYLTEFRSTIGNLENIEDLVLFEEFKSSPSDRWLLGQHYYDYRSGHFDASAGMSMSTAPAVGASGGITLKYDNTVGRPGSHYNISGARLSNKLNLFRTQAGRSIFIRFRISLSNSTSISQHSRIVLTLNPDSVESSFKVVSTTDADVIANVPCDGLTESQCTAAIQAFVDRRRCEREITGTGVAFVLEDAGSTTSLRVEKQTGYLPGMGNWSGSCSVQGGYNALSLYGTTTACDPGGCSTPFADAGPYASASKRFTLLNPSDYPTAVLDKPNEISYQQQNITPTTEELEEVSEHKIEIRHDNVVKWTAYGQTYTFSDLKKSSTSTGLEIDNGLRYVSIKMQQDTATSSSSEVKTHVGSLIITIDNSSP